MSGSTKIADQARTPNLTNLNVAFSDGFEWQFDDQNNHRLINRILNLASDWVRYEDISVVGDKFIATEYYSDRFPIKRLLQYADLNQPGTPIGYNPSSS